MKNYFTKLSRSFSILIALVFSVNFLPAQVAINTDGSAPNSSAMLDVKSSDKGLLIPRLTTAQRTTLASTAVAGLMVYDTNLNRFFFFNGTTWDSGSVGNLWSRSGTYTYLSNTSDKVGIGTTTPAQPLDIHTTSEPAFARLKSDNAYAGIMIEKGDAADNGYILYRTGSTNYWSVGMIGDNNFHISTNYSSTDTKLFINSSGQVGIGTITPSRTLEVKGVFQTARISSIQAGATLEFVSSVANDWAIGTWSGSMIFLNSTNDFTSKTDEYYMTTSSFYPVSSNSKTLGATSNRWSNIYSVGGNFSGNVGIGITSPTEALQVVTIGDNRTAYFTGAGIGIPDATVYSENTSTGGIAGYFESNGTDATIVVGQNGTGKFIKAFGPNGGNEEFSIDNNGTFNLYNSSFVRTIQIAPIEGGGTTGGQITLYGPTGLATIEIDGDYQGDGRITTNELQITGGSDLSEFFDLSNYENIQKGMVVSIDENNQGHLMVSKVAYDRKVAGIISGANNIEPGLIMSQKGTIADGEHLVALSGRVYCMVDATNKPVAIGDMLTTSSVPGHAMKVEDFDWAHGAIIGKAMTSLDTGKGLVLVLVSLQ